MSTTLEERKSSQSHHDHPRGSVAGLVLAAAGALLVVVGVLVHFYAVPKLAVAPVDEHMVTHLEAKNATVFNPDPSVLKASVTDLQVTARITGDANAVAHAPDHVVVWVNATTVKASWGVVQQNVERAATDDRTGAAVNFGDNWFESTAGQKVPVKRTGQIYKFPFDTQKQSYQYWDNTVNAAVTAKFTGTTVRNGVAEYVFQYTVPPTVVGSQELPASLLGLTGAAVNADSYYQMHTTFYIEPVTGAVMNQVNDTKTWFSYAGHDLTTMQGTVAFTPKQIQDMVDLLGSQPALLSMVSGLLPWIVVVLGLLMIVFGRALVERRKLAA
jgi:hypothetical protein